MKPKTSLYLSGKNLLYADTHDQIVAHIDRFFSHNEWTVQTILHELSNSSCQIRLIVFDKEGLQKLLSELHPFERPRNEIVHIVQPDEEIIIPRHLIGAIRKKPSGVTAWNTQDSEIISTLEGNLARAFWDYAVKDVQVTITGDPEEWQLDLSDFDYVQLLAIADLVISVERHPCNLNDGIIELADDVQAELPTRVLDHIAKLDSAGRAKFLADVANALASLAPQEESRLP